MKDKCGLARPDRPGKAAAVVPRKHTTAPQLTTRLAQSLAQEKEDHREQQQQNHARCHHVPPLTSREPLLPLPGQAQLEEKCEACPPLPPLPLRHRHREGDGQGQDRKQRGMASSFAMRRLLDRHRRGFEPVMVKSAATTGRQGLLPPHATTVRNCLAASSSAVFEEEGDDSKKTKFLEPYARPPSPAPASGLARAAERDTETPSVAANGVWVWGGRRPDAATPRLLEKNVGGAAAGDRKDTALTVKVDGVNAPV